MTFTLDEQTAHRIESSAARLGMPKSGVVREAVAEYSARTGMLSAGERARMLKLFDAVVPQIPGRSAAAVDRELKEIRLARRRAGSRAATRKRG